MKGTLHPALALDHQAQADALLAQQPLLARKIAVATALDEQAASQMLREVLRFLSLIVASGQVLTPPRILDLAWHEFILFTRAYAQWCEATLGRFIHHTPGGSPEENGAQLRRTLKLYTLTFGAPDVRFWGYHGYLSEGADCGACEGP